jgi:hypothetical protein
MRKFTSLLLGVMIGLILLMPLGAYCNVAYSWGPKTTYKVTIEAQRGIEFADDTIQISAAISTGAISTTYVAVAGDTMTGNLTVGAIDVNSLINGVSIANATTTGILTTAAFDAQYNDLTNIGTPDANFEATTKLYVDTADALKSNIANPTFTGIVTSPAIDVDSLINGVTITGIATASSADIDSLVNGITIANATTTGILTTAAFDANWNDLTNVGTADANGEAVNKGQMDTADALLVPIAGLVTLTGDITSSASIYINTSAEAFILKGDDDAYYKITVVSGSISAESL